MTKRILVSKNVPANNAGTQSPIALSSNILKDANGISGPVTGQQQKEITPEVHVLSDSSACQKCGCDIHAGKMLASENGKATCLKCAGLDHLIILRSGKATLTRRAVNQFGPKIVVLRIWERAPAWRLGVLVDQEALERAHAQCAADAEKRAKSQEKAAIRRKKEDADLAARFADKIGLLYPGCPVDERVAIARHACERGSGRVGRSASGQQQNDEAIKRAVRAHIRHVHTDYEQQINGQARRCGARHHDWAHDHVRTKVDEVYKCWQAGTSVEGDRA